MRALVIDAALAAWIPIEDMHWRSTRGTSLGSWPIPDLNEQFGVALNGTGKRRF